MNDFFSITRTTGLMVRPSAPLPLAPGIGAYGEASHNSMGLPAVTLDELGRRLDQELLAGRREYIARATRLGNILIEAKQLLPDGHGSWLPWLEEHGISDRTAQHWMKIARDPEAEIARRLAKSATVALLEEPEPLSPEDTTAPLEEEWNGEVEFDARELGILEAVTAERGLSLEDAAKWIVDD